MLVASVDETDNMSKAKAEAESAACWGAGLGKVLPHLSNLRH